MSARTGLMCLSCRHYGWAIGLSLLMIYTGALGQTSGLDRIVLVSIDAGPLGPALTVLSTQVGVQVIAASASVNGLSTSGVHGRMTLSAALIQLLKGTALSFYMDGRNTISVGEQRRSAIPGGNDPPYNSPTSGAGEQPDITVRESASTTTQAAQSSNGGNAVGDNKMKRPGFLSRLFGMFALCGAAALAANPACAQTSTSGDQATSASSAGSPDQIQEVVVTATRREENLQRVPVTVTAITADEIQDLHITNGFDITKLVPNMFVDTVDGDRSTPRYNIRGVGSNDSTAEASTSVGVYSDGIFLNNILTQSVAVFDENRIEVLRGPQGTLWGKNTSAGTVNFVSNQPTSDFEGYGRATYGDYNFEEAEGAISGPLSDTLGARFSFFTSSRDGLYFNSVTHNKDQDFTDTAARGQLLWSPTDSFKAQTIISTRNLREDQTYFVQGINLNGTNFAGYPSSLTTTQTWFDQPWLIATRSLAEHLAWTVPNGLNLTSDTGYVAVSPGTNYSDGGADPAVTANSTQVVNLHQYSEELHLSSRTDAPLHWLVGAYVLEEHLNSFQTSSGPSTAVNADVQRLTIQDTHSNAVLANVDQDFGRLNVRLGARYTSETKSISIVGTQYTGDPFNIFNPSASGLPLGPLSTNIADKTTSGKITWDATVDYNFDAAKMVYARIATGFKAAEYNDGVTGFTVPNGFAAKPENLVDYEVGTKTSWADNRLQLNADAFYYYYTDYQIATIIAAIGSQTALVNSLANARSASVTGVEGELTALPVDNLFLRLSGGWDNAHFINFTNASVSATVNSGLPLNVSGNRLPRAPTGTASAEAQYTIPMQNNRDIQLQTDWNYVGNTNFDIWLQSTVHPGAAYAALLPEMRAALEQNAYFIGNASLAMRWGANHESKLSFWVKNLSNATYRLNRYQDFTLGEVVAYRGDPRTFGVSFQHDFGRNR